MSGDRLAGPGRSFEPDPLRQLILDFRDLQRRVDDMGAQILRSAGLRAEPGLLRVLGSLIVEGTLNVAGNTIIGGTLSLPNGIIDNAALASPVVPITFRNVVSGFALTAGASSDVAPMTLTAPSGMTKAAIVATGLVNATNSSGQNSWISVVTRIAGVDGIPANGPITANGYTMSVNLADSQLVQSTSIALSLRTYLAYGPASSTQAFLGGVALWFR